MTRTADPFDELAAMFLTERDREQNPPTHPALAGIELLVVGHLPVRAGLWLTPYADATARTQEGRTALVRLDGDEPMIQLFGKDTDCIDRARSLSEAIFDLGDSVRNWVIRPSARSEMPHLIRKCIDRLTILSSSDQAALVNAYRLVKNLVECARQLGRAVPEMGLVLIGTDDQTAHEVAGKLNTTTRSCLNVDVPLVRCLPRIDAALRSGALRSFPGHERPTLDDVLSWIELARSCPKPQPTEAEPPVIEVPRREDGVELQRAQGAHEVLGEPEAALGEPAAAPSLCPGPESRGTEVESLRPSREGASSSQDRPARVQSAGGTSDADDTAFGFGLAEEIVEERNAASVRRMKLTPKASAEVEMRAPARAQEPEDKGGPASLAHFAKGLTAIAPRCPGHERVELALDAEGRIHLLAREDSLRELPLVEAWAKAHRELLAMACREHQFDPSGRTMCHVFTEQPVSVADLHGARLKLHVLAPVQVGDRVGWYAAPLNELRE